MEQRMQDLIIGTELVEIAADIRAWCFNEGAERERVRLAKAVPGTEGNREVGQKMELGALDAMAGEAGKALGILESIKSQNMDSLEKGSILPGQRAAILECNDQLDRGISKIKAYLGPYLGVFRDKVQKAQMDGLANLGMPMPVLPANFPFQGELVEFGAEELRNYPVVNLGHGQKGKFVHPPSFQASPQEAVIGMVQAYDNEEGHWLLSRAKGELASKLLSGEAYRTPAKVFLDEQKPGHRVGWLHHETGERLPVRLAEWALTPRARRAPYGTSLQVYLHKADFGIRHIEGRETMAWDHGQPRYPYPCRAREEFWDAYQSALVLSDKMLIRQAGMAGDPKGATYILRLANSAEFPLGFNLAERTVEVGLQCGSRLGMMGEAGKGFHAYLFYGGFSPVASGGTHPPAELEKAIKESFRWQEGLKVRQELANQELRNLMAVLRAEVRSAPLRKRMSMEFTAWAASAKAGTGSFTVKFQGTGSLPRHFAVCLQGENQPLGWTIGNGKARGVEVDIAWEAKRHFQTGDFPQAGVLQAYPVGRPLLYQIGALQDFLSSSGEEHFQSGETAASRILCQELSGIFTSHLTESPALETDKRLDEHQAQAVSLLAGNAPLVLIQDPPGAGKTHALHQGIDKIIKGNPEAKILVTSHSDAAIDALVAKIKKSSPELKIYREDPNASKGKNARGNRGDGLDKFLANVRTSIDAPLPQANPDLAPLSTWLHETILRNPDKLRLHCTEDLSKEARIVACTLQRLARLSSSLPQFDLVILDDAAHASLLEVTLAANCAKRLALVGDPKKRLPYLDESYYEHSAPDQEEHKVLKEIGDYSLFSLLWNQAPASRKSFLAMIRTSRKPIAQCISHCFYEGHLQLRRTMDSPIFPTPISLFWIDSGHTKHMEKETVSNPDEAMIVLQALERLHALSKKPFSSAVIAFHQGQAELLNRMASSLEGIPKPDVRTVEESQGRQWDVVVISLARTQGTPGFVGNPNRLNVALSRAKEICILVGSKGYVEKSWLKESFLPDVLGFFQQGAQEGTMLVGLGEDGMLPPSFGKVPEPKPKRKPAKPSKQVKRGGRRKK